MPGSCCLEDGPEGRSLVVTGAWSAEAKRLLGATEVDGLVLNYARGFSDQTLDFLDASWGLRRLSVLDRGISNLEPLSRLADTLESLSIQAADNADLQLDDLHRLVSVAAEWHLLASSLGRCVGLQAVSTWAFDEPDLRAFRDHADLAELTIKDAPRLASLDGAASLFDLESLKVAGAPRLGDLAAISGLDALRELTIESASAVESLNDIAGLVQLRFLSMSDCKDIASLQPLSGMQQLETFYAWGSTRVLDDDLRPLLQLPLLSEVRMRARRSYRPLLTDVPASVF